MDFDVDGSENKHLKVNAQGDWYIETIWESTFAIGDLVDVPDPDDPKEAGYNFGFTGTLIDIVQDMEDDVFQIPLRKIHKSL